MAGSFYAGKMSEGEKLAAADIAEEDKALIKKFVSYKVAEKSITTHRAEKLARTLRLISMPRAVAIATSASTRKRIKSIVIGSLNPVDPASAAQNGYKRQAQPFEGLLACLLEPVVVTNLYHRLHRGDQ